MKNRLIFLLLLGGFATSRADNFVWDNAATSGTLNWSDDGNWSGGAPSSGAATTLEFFTGQTLPSGTVTSSNDIASPPFALNILTLSGTGPASVSTTVNLGGNALNFSQNGATHPVVNLDALSGNGLAYNVNNAITLSDTVTFTGSGTAAFKFGGAISGIGGLTKSGTSILQLSANNDFAGAVAVNAGVVALLNLGAVAGSSGVTVANGATLQANLAAGTYANVPITITGVGAFNQRGALFFNNTSVSAVTWPGAITLNGNATIASYGVNMNQTLSGPITGTGSLSLLSEGGAANHTAGYAITNANNTWTGSTTIAGGAQSSLIVKLGVTNALPITTALTITNYNGRTTQLELNGFSQTLKGLAVLVGGGGAAANSGVINTSAIAATLKINTATNTSFTGVLGGGATGNNFGIIKIGAGNFTLTGTNTYTGTTSVRVGKLLLSAATNNIANSALVEVLTGATLGVDGIAGGCIFGTGQTITGGGTVTGSVTINGTHRPGIGAETQTFTGSLAYGAASHLAWELTGNAESGANIFDQVSGQAVTVAAGALIDIALNSTGSAVDLSNAFWLQNHTWTVIAGTSVNGNFALGTISGDLAGHAASNYGAFSIQQTASAVNLVWTSAYQDWKTAHFGANAGDPAIAGDNVDFDGDGATNLEEYLALTDPKISTDHLAVKNIAVADSAVEVTVAAHAGRVYILERNADMLSPWTEVTRSGTIASDQDLPLTDNSPSGTQDFYRVRVQIP